MVSDTLDTTRKLNIDKTSIKCPRHLLNVFSIRLLNILCTFNLRLGLADKRFNLRVYKRLIYVLVQFINFSPWKCFILLYKFEMISMVILFFDYNDSEN